MSKHHEKSTVHESTAGGTLGKLHPKRIPAVFFRTRQETSQFGIYSERWHPRIDA